MMPSRCQSSRSHRGWVHWWRCSPSPARVPAAGGDGWSSNGGTTLRSFATVWIFYACHEPARGRNTMMRNAGRLILILALTAGALWPAGATAAQAEQTGDRLELVSLTT